MASVEISGEGDPEEIGDEERGGGFGKSGELADGEGDEDPEENDDDEGGGDLMGSEKEGRPGEVEDELGEEEKGKTGLADLVREVVPDECEADADQDVEAGPDGAENPVWRGAGWLVEVGIPGVHGAGGDDASDSAEEDHSEGADDNFCGEGFRHGRTIKRD